MNVTAVSTGMPALLVSGSVAEGFPVRGCRAPERCFARSLALAAVRWPGGPP